MNLLEKFDKKYKLERARLIAENYNEVVGKIHESFQNNFINKFLSFELQVVEIVKFDYMTNLHSDGDKNLWIDFIDQDNMMHNFEIMINPNGDNFITLDKKQRSLHNSNISRENIKEFTHMCLDVFHRGYDKEQS